MTSFRHILLIRFMTFISVISFKHFMTFISCITLITYTHYGQVHQVLGLADHVWQDKRAAIAKTVDDLGDLFRPAMRAGWLTYIRHGQRHPCACPPVGQGTVVLPD